MSDDLRPEYDLKKLLKGGERGKYVMSLATNQILQTLAGHRDAIRAFGARRLGLFGSQARGEATDKSDLDFLVEFEPGTKTFDNYMDLKAFLEDLFNRPVDLVVSDAIKPRLREGILRETIYAPGF
ncbi:MAG TPA: nucleotidyltransferase family protein [Thermoanaerobaculia bacterium]